MLEIFLICEAVLFFLGFICGMVEHPILKKFSFWDAVLVGLVFVFIYISLPTVIYLRWRDKKLAQEKYGV